MVEGRWRNLGVLPALAEGDMAARSVDGWPVVVARAGGALVAFIDRCPHQATRLSGGRIRKAAVMCPLHGARFALADGRCIGGAYADLRLFSCREANGAIEVAIPEAAPTVADLPASA